MPSASEPPVSSFPSCTRSQKVIWLLEELGVADYKVKRYERLPTKLAPPDLKDVHPLGKAPVLEDKGKVIAETCKSFMRLGPGRASQSLGSRSAIWI